MGINSKLTKNVKKYISESFALSTVALSSTSYSNFISLARNLLNEFGSIKSIIDADEKDLQKAEGLGKGKAKKIHKLLNAKFKDERDKVLDN